MRRIPNLVLIGFMATGKTSVGRRCAAALGFEFRDTDVWIEAREGKSIREIFTQEGEARFREIEAEAVRTLCCEAPIVLSTGGGVPLNPENVRLLRENGVVALLAASPESILKRTGDRATRPLLSAAEDPLARISEMLQARKHAYESAADFAVDSSNLPTEQTARLVLQGYRERAGLAGIRAESAS